MKKNDLICFVPDVITTAFRCSKLASVIMPPSLTNIGHRAFRSTALSSPDQFDWNGLQCSNLTCVGGWGGFCLFPFPFGQCPHIYYGKQNCSLRVTLRSNGQLLSSNCCPSETDVVSIRILFVCSSAQWLSFSLSHCSLLRTYRSSIKASRSLKLMRLRIAERYNPSTKFCLGK